MQGDVVGLGAGCENLSIMIPTFNCARLLVETLESLKAQGDALAGAQIEVVDDCSTKDDPEAVAREVWPGRVTFWRHPRNGGLVNNFNTCLARASRPWIHILHGDDFVLPGAYAEFDRCLAEYPDADAVFARTVIVDESGVWSWVGGRLGPGRRGLLGYEPGAWAGNPLQFAGVLVSSRAVDAVGGFNPDYCHCADWNMWWRIAKGCRVAYSNVCIGAYREFAGNHTSSLRRTGRNLDECLRMLRELASSTREAQGAGVDTDAYFRPTFGRIASQCSQYIDDAEGFAANFRLFRQVPRRVRRIAPVLLLRLRRARRQLRTFWPR